MKDKLLHKSIVTIFSVSILPINEHLGYLKRKLIVALQGKKTLHIFSSGERGENVIYVRGKITEVKDL